MNNRYTKLIPAAIIAGITATLIAPTAASAIWSRAFSSLEIRSDDISLCADEMTFETEYRANRAINPPTYVHALGTPWPLNGGIDNLALYGTAADAVAATNPIATVTVPLVETFIDPDGVWDEWTGRTTIATPAGYDAGDQIFVSTFLDFTTNGSQALTIGDAKYNCVPPEQPINVSATALKFAKRIIVTFDTGTIAPSTIKVSANNGTPASPEIYASFFGKSLVVVRFSSIGLNCATTSVVMTATTTTGQPLRGERPLRDPRCPVT
jgi:hypothetical protein